MHFLTFSIFAALIVAADQFTKYLTVANIALYEDVPFIPGLLQFTYIQNTGAAFSSFEGQQWLFALIFVVLTLGVLAMLGLMNGRNDVQLSLRILGKAVSYR